MSLSWHYLILLGNQHVDLQDVFGTKRLKPTQDTKMKHVETMQFIPNVIVQWKCAHETHRDKIRNIVHAMGPDIGAQIAYIDAEEEAKTGYIRFCIISPCYYLIYLLIYPLSKLRLILFKTALVYAINQKDYRPYNNKVR